MRKDQIMNKNITGINAYIFVAAIARLSGVTDNTALKYCREKFEALYKKEDLNGDDIIQSVADEIMENTFGNNGLLEKQH